MDTTTMRRLVATMGEELAMGNADRVAAVRNVIMVLTGWDEAERDRLVAAAEAYAALPLDDPMSMFTGPNAQVREAILAAL